MFLVHLHSLPWKPTGPVSHDPDSRLSFDLHTEEGTSFHFHAIQVDEAGQAVNPRLRHVLALVAELNGVDDPCDLEIAEIRGKSYVVYSTPFAV